MPAYNAEKTLEVTVGELPDLVDIRILVDDHSSDKTVDLARRLGLLVFQHDRNYGYGRNQQTCYREALAAGADVVIGMLHPDYQYTPLLGKQRWQAWWLTTCTTLSWARALSAGRPCAGACQSINTSRTACLLRLRIFFWA